MSQGDIWWADLPGPAGRRPVLILTRSSALPRLRSATFAPITRTVRGIATEVKLGPADGLPSECAASFDNIGTAYREIFDRRIATLGRARMSEVFEAIRRTFDMPAQ